MLSESYYLMIGVDFSKA